MAPLKILTNNLLYDFSQVPIPTDEMDPEQVAKPRPWSMGEISRFILFIGPCSSVFDYTTYAMMWFIFKCSNLGLVPPELAARFAQASATNPDSTYAAALFQTGWFVESLLTQTLIIHVIRTKQDPIHPEPRQLAIDHDYHGDHGNRDVVADVADRTVAGVCTPAHSLLAPAIADAPGVCRLDAGSEGVAGCKLWI